VQAKNAAAQSGLEKSNANTADQEARRAIYKFQSEGLPKSLVNQALHPLWDEMAAARAQAGGAAGAGAKTVDPLTAMTTQPTGPVTPGWVTEQRNAMPAPAMPAQSSVTAPTQGAAMPISTSDTPTPTPSGSPLVEYKSSLIKLEKAKAAQEDAQRDIRLLEKAKENGHFDAETLARARAKLEEYTLAYQKQGLVHVAAAENWRKRVQAEEGSYNAANAPTVSKQGRPSYVDALAHKYR
jgi:hypothetical protein